MALKHFPITSQITEYHTVPKQVVTSTDRSSMWRTTENSAICFSQSSRMPKQLSLLTKRFLNTPYSNFGIHKVEFKTFLGWRTGKIASLKIGTSTTWCWRHFPQPCRSKFPFPVVVLRFQDLPPKPWLLTVKEISTGFEYGRLRVSFRRLWRQVARREGNYSTLQ